MVSFGGSSKKKATTTASNDKETSKIGSGSAITTNSSPTKTITTSAANAKATSPKSGGLNSIFRKVMITPPSKTTTTPATAPSTPVSPDSSVKITKERPNVDTIDVPISSSTLSPTLSNHKPSISGAGNASLLDNPDIYRIDSVLSDLSGSIAAPQQQSQAAPATTDPPALMLRSHSIEVNSGSSGYNTPNILTVANTNTSSSTAASPPLVATSAESIVTKVLGIVDLSCVSSGLVPTPTTTSVTAGNSGDTAATNLKPSYSFQPEWGVAPHDEETTLLPGGDSSGSNHSSGVSEKNPISTNGSSTIKKELAEIAARASGPSTLQYDTNIDSSKQYRRYHETFELVYTEPKDKKKLKNRIVSTNGTYDTETNGVSNMNIDRSFSAKQNKATRINQWVTNKWKAKQQKTFDANSSSLVIDIVPHEQQSSQPLLDDINATTNTSSKSPAEFGTSSAPASILAETSTEATTTVTTTTAPTTEVSSNKYSGSLCENIETTNSGSRNNAVVVLSTTGANAAETSESFHVSFTNKPNINCKSKGWYRFSKPNNNPTKSRKELKTSGSNKITVVAPNVANRASPTKKKGLKNGGYVVENTNSHGAKELQPTKIILKSIKSSTIGLETVAEEEYFEENTELKVRVPGFQNEDSYLSDHDLIGSEIVEEIYTPLEKSVEEDKEEQDRENKTVPSDIKESTGKDQDSSSCIPVLSSDAIPIDKTLMKAIGDGYQEICDAGIEDRKKAESVVRPQRTKTWKERFRFKKGESDTKIVIPSTPPTVSVPSSSREAVTSLVTETTTPHIKKQKPLWKAVVDPATGNTYYYHKKTRETTWTKPPECDIAPPKPISVTPIPMEDTDEIDKAMRTNAQPVITATAEEVVKVDEIHENYMEDVDRMMSDITHGGESNVNYASEEENDEFESFTQPDGHHESSRPFDEPIAELDYPDDEKTKGDTTARTRTTTSIYSGFSSRFSAKSRISELTQPIKNLSSNRTNLDANNTGISSNHEDISTDIDTSLRNRRPPRIPKNIPVPRLRELNVEEFTTRDMEFKRRALRIPKAPRHGLDNNSSRPLYSMSNANTSEVAENDDADADKSTVSYAATDSISALSEADLSFVDRKEAYDDARRRALDRAIAQEDWDLAAKLSESMRKTFKTSNNANQNVPREWVQSEMDRFISENDWDAVAAYIAQVRANASESSQKQIQSHLGVVPPSRAPLSRVGDGPVRNVKSTSSDVSGTSNPQKIFGARSQLQHRDIDSVESHSSYSTTFDSEYTSESYEQRSEEERRPGPRPRQQEFAC